jgi:hypothetical protein
MMAIVVGGLILSSKPESVMTEACRELLGVWDGIRGFNDDDSTEGNSGQTW